ncbi:early nodulin-like protein 3 [Lotus japonicus]|uniref:early nodulin-like protein 3 n=1 Tax=Lotus japonicus TaxID=34305 RepID=UPI0025904E9A|nr:early nodulin-like protein 3 [Lotus japonicus]
MTMGSYHQFLCPILLIISMVILASSSSSQAYKFIVGGKDGWVVKPSEKYSHWAERNRFQVNDTLYFKYKKGSDSVAVVTKEDYDACNPKNPIHIMDGGDSTFQFDRSGPFFFISGNVENCQHGQKLIVVVLAVIHNQHHHSDQSPSPSAPPSSPVPPPAEAQPHVRSGPSPMPSPGPSGIEAPAPAPASHSGSTRLGGVALGVSVGVALLFFV